MATARGQSIWDAGPFLRVPQPFNLTEHTMRAGRATPDKVALEVISGPGQLREAWRFAEVEAAICGTMTGLAARGLGRGDRLLLRLGHSIDFPILFFAAMGLGAIPIPSSAQWTSREVSAATALARPKLVAAAPGIEAGTAPIVGPQDYHAWRALPPAAFAVTEPDDPAFMVFTSGTGGQPKGVLHAHRSGWARRMMWRDWMDLRSSDRVLHAGAFNWTYTLGTGLTDPWAAGATALIFDGPGGSALWPQLLARHGATLFAASPGVFRQILRSGEGLPTLPALRHALCAGDTLPAGTAQTWHARTGTRIHQALGMSEISTYASDAPGYAAVRPQRGRRIAVLSADHEAVPPGTPGRIAVSIRDPGLMLGYWRGADQPPDLPCQGEWFDTGDIATMAEDGTLTHQGRADDILNAQGYRVSPVEVEEVLLQHPRVAEAGVAARTLKQDVELITAFIVPCGDDSGLAAALAAHCAENLARYKCPRAFYAVPELPRTANGKLIRRALRDIDI
ncbi:MAG: acyl-CoA synthetase [Pseudomonadota bacterium]